MLIPAWLKENIYHVSILIDSTPQILPLSPNCYEQFIHVPDVAQATLSVPDHAGILATEFPTPLSNGFVGNCDPALCQQVFNISKAQAESVVKPNSMADDIRWKSMSVIIGSVGGH